MVMGMHNYYCMATLVSADFAEIAFKVTGKSNGMNHNRRCFPHDLDIQVSKLKLMKANHTSQKYRLEDNIAKHYPQQITILKERISGIQALRKQIFR